MTWNKRVTQNCSYENIWRKLQKLL